MIFAELGRPSPFLEEAYRKVPKKWYEDSSRMIKIRKYFKRATDLGTISYFGLLLSGNDSPMYHLAGAGVFIASQFLANYGEFRYLNAAKQAKRSGIIAKSDRDIFPSQIKHYLAGIALPLMVPSYAITVGSVNLFDVMGNLRMAKRYNRATEIATSGKITPTIG